MICHLKSIHPYPTRYDTRLPGFDDGKLVETGPYGELILRDGLFAELVRAAETGTADAQAGSRAGAA